MAAELHAVTGAFGGAYPLNFHTPDLARRLATRRRGSLHRDPQVRRVSFGYPSSAWRTISFSVVNVYGFLMNPASTVAGTSPVESASL